MRSAVASALLLAVLATAGGSQAAFPGKAGKLVFQSNRDGNYELYVANANGSGVRKLLSRPQTDEFNANWSPSGRHLVFQTGPPDGSNFDLWLAGADGKDSHPILAGKTNDRAPQFCDFDTIVFTRQLSPTSSDVYSLDLATRRVRRLTNHPATDSFPTCHPKRDEIAFISAREGLPRIYVMTRAGARQRPLVAAPSLDPDYSTDGKALAYVAPDADRNLDVFTMNIASGAVTQRTNVKPPVEFRLPKFLPAATRSTSAVSGPDDKIVATERDTSTTPAKEAVWEVVAGPTRPLGEPASGGSVQPDATGYCKCESIDAEVERAIKRVVEDEAGGLEELIIDITLSWTIACAKGKVGCLGTVSPLPARGFRIFGGGFTHECGAACERSDTNSGLFSLTSGNAKAAQGGVVFRIRFICEQKRTEKFYKLVFKPRGLVDREKSDLNGNRVPDGKER